MTKTKWRWQNYDDKMLNIKNPLTCNLNNKSDQNKTNQLIEIINLNYLLKLILIKMKDWPGEHPFKLNFNDINVRIT